MEEAVEDLKNQSEEMMYHSTPLTLSEQGSTTDSPPKPLPKRPSPALVPGFGVGVFSDTAQLDQEDFQMLRNLQEIEPERVVDKFVAEKG